MDLHTGIYYGIFQAFSFSYYLNNSLISSVVSTQPFNSVWLLPSAPAFTSCTRRFGPKLLTFAWSEKQLNKCKCILQSFSLSPVFYFQSQNKMASINESEEPILLVPRHVRTLNSHNA